MDEQTAKLLESLKDIKDPVVVPDTSFYLFIGLIILALGIITLLAYLAWKKFRKKRPKHNIRAICLERLQTIDWSDPKSASYAITRYGRHLADDERSKRLYAELTEMLESHKYKKEVPEISAKTQAHFQLFWEVVNA